MLVKLTNKLLAWLPQFDRRVWLLMVGRLLSQVGTGFVLFYAAIFFVNQVGLSPAAVGFGIGSESISGVVGRVVGGSLADSPRWGRRKILLISAAISVIADLVLAISNDFPTFLTGNLLMGLGIGLYWPSAEAVVADLTNPTNRNEAYALNRLSDSVGMGMGVILGGWIIAATGAYRALFVLDGISFAVFFGVIYVLLSETLNHDQTETQVLQSWATAGRDRPLLTFIVANILFTTYLALINSTLPLYLTRFVSATPSQTFSPPVLSTLFAWYIGLCIVCQLPTVRLLKHLENTRVLMISAGLWMVSFGFIWGTGNAASAHPVWAGGALAMMALATVAYTPSASSLVISLAPESLRGVYLSINSLCWAGGYFIGPTVGGWAMGESRAVANGFWIASALTVVVIFVILKSLDQQLQRLHKPYF
jgi:MFS family permease